ncbi:MAG: helix-turn-helix transcriptional regulator [Clostridia bacterium]|nr:helix-turn-helix transcriptional regulator [Clostridia bacterium]
MRLPISQVIKRLRKEKNITQEDLARVLNVTYQSVSRWENDLAYPDVELIPLIANYFEVTTDVLFGTDETTVEYKRQEYLKAIKEQQNIYSDDDFKRFEKTLIEAIKSFPKDVFFQWKICSLYHRMGLECSKKNIEAMRKYAKFVIENDKSIDGIYRIGCIRVMIRVEDEDKLESWTKYVSESFYTSLPSILTSRYNYRDEIEKYNEQIQWNIIYALEDIFNRDFCKRDAKTYKNAKSRAEGQRVILGIIDVMSNPDEKMDAWLQERAMGYLRLAGGLVGSGEIEEGFEALEKAVDLYIKICNIPVGTVLKYNCPSLDLITRTVDDDFKQMNMQTIYNILSNSEGWEWLNPIRETERFKALLNKVTEYID